jgi:hypothetical protein
MRTRTIKITLFLFFMTFQFSSCQSNKNLTNMQAIQFIPKEFQNIKVGLSENEINECTPKNYETIWDEIVINAPTKIIIASIDIKPIIPICGYSVITDKTSTINSDRAGLFVNIFNVNADEKIIFSGLIAESDSNINEHPDPNPFISDNNQEYDEYAAVGEAINIDVMKYIDFPVATGTYEIFFSSFGLESNHVQVEIVFEK